MHLRYKIMTAYMECNENRHPQIVMEELGITYQHATPQSIADQWWFWNCDHVPTVMPQFLTPLNLDPLDQVGWGLSKAEAKQISDWKPKS